MPFYIVRNDITKMNTDAIVNAANEKLLQGGGVCGAIFAAAGSDALQKECDAIGFCPTGSAVITSGGRAAKYIIHAVGPIYSRDVKNEEAQLYSCYKKSLELAKEKSLDSIAFPLISSGIFGYPKSEALKIATRAIKDFLEENYMDIYLVVYDNAAFSISEKLFERVQSFIDEKLIDDERRSFNSYERTALPGAATMTVQYDMASPRTLDKLVNQSAETFSQMLFRLIDERGMSDVCVYKRANIDRKLFSKIRGKDYTPSKPTVIALAIALSLSLDETKDLLRKAGYALSDCSKGDVIIEYFISASEYDIFKINEALFYFEQPLLGV